MVVDAGMDRGELLQGFHSSESEHRPFSSSERKVAVFNPVVGVSADLLLLLITKLAHRRAVGSKAVGNDRLGRSVTLQRLLHEGERGFPVPGFSHVAFEDLALVIDRAPKVDISPPSFT